MNPRHQTNGRTRLGMLAAMLAAAALLGVTHGHAMDARPPADPAPAPAPRVELAAENADAPALPAQPEGRAEAAQADTPAQAAARVQRDNINNRFQIPFVNNANHKQPGLTGRKMVSARNTNRRLLPNGALMRSDGEVPVGQLVAHASESKSSEAAADRVLGLRDLSVHCNIEGTIARTTVRHVFLNQTDAVLEGVFTFAIPSGAAVDRFAMTIVSEDDLMEGSLLDRNRARNVYTSLVYGQAVDPGVLEWLGENTFRATIFPIPARGTKTIVVSYLESLPQALIGEGKRQVQYRFPLMQLDAQGKSLPPASRVHLAASLHLPKGAKIDSSFDTDRETGLWGETKLDVGFEGNPRFEKDWTITYTLPDAASAECQAQAHRSADTEDGVFALTITPPTPTIQATDGQDVIFMVDTSASRDGSQFAGAMRLIEGAFGALSENDRFTVVPFDVTARPLPEGWLAVTPRNLDRALDFLALKAPMGATDVAGAFRTTAAHFGPTARAHTRVIYIGDTHATYGERSFKLFKKTVVQHINDLHAELITVWPGKGAETMDTLTEKEHLTRLGELSGTPVWKMTTLVRPEVLGRQLASQFDLPIISHARLTLRLPGELFSVTANPHIHGGLYGNVSAHFFGSYKRPGKAEVRLVGSCRNKPYDRSWWIDLPRIENGNADVAKLAARSEIEQLEADGQHEKAKHIALQHRVLSHDTAFLVLESEQMYRDFNIQRTQRDRTAPARDPRRPLIAGRSVPNRARRIETSGENTAASVPALRIGQPANIQALTGPIQIGASKVDVIVSLRKVDVPAQRTEDDNLWLEPQQRFERRVKLSRLIASERSLPFEPEIIFGEILLKELTQPALDPKEVDPNRFDFMRDGVIWKAVDTQSAAEAPAFRRATDATPDLETELKLLLQPMHPTNIKLDPAGHARVWMHGSEAIHHLAARLAGQPNAHLVKNDELRERRRAFQTRHTRVYDLSLATPEAQRAFYHFLAMTSLVEGQVKQARQAIHRALQLAPAGSEDQAETARLSHLIAGVTSHIHGDYNEAATHYERMLKGAQLISGSGHDLTYWSLITVMSQAGHKEGAVAVLEKWAASAMNKAELSRHLGRAYLELNRIDDATRAFSTPIEIDPALADTCPTVTDIILNMK